MRRIRLVFSVLGFLVALGGATFVLQGRGIVGPPDSFMFSNGQWTYNGVIVLVIGVVMVVLGFALRQTAPGSGSPPSRSPSREERRPSPASSLG